MMRQRRVPHRRQLGGLENPRTAHVVLTYYSKYWKLGTLEIDRGGSENNTRSAVWVIEQSLKSLAKRYRELPAARFRSDQSDTDQVQDANPVFGSI